MKCEFCGHKIFPFLGYLSVQGKGIYHFRFHFSCYEKYKKVLEREVILKMPMGKQTLIKIILQLIRGEKERLILMMK